jgi:hypothetical protein
MESYMTIKVFDVSDGDLLTASNWSPDGVPAASDTAEQFSGTSHLYNATFPTPLQLSGGSPGGATLDIYHGSIDVHLGGGGPVGVGYGTIAAADNSTVNMNVVGGGYGAGDFIVDISPWDNMTGTLTMAGSPSGGSSVTINGSSDTYTHNGITSLESNDVVLLNTTTIGNGSWDIGFLSSLTVDGAMSQNVTVDGGILDLGLPGAFSGSVALVSNAAANAAVGLSQLFATAASYDGNTLTLDYGSQVIDDIKVSGAPFDVYQTNTGVQIADSTNYIPPSGSTLLLHT